MAAIWKYPLQVTDWQEVRMPPGKPLCVQMQGDQLCMWAEVVPHGMESTRQVRIYGTGHTMDPVGSGSYVGTVQIGELVFHVYVD